MVHEFPKRTQKQPDDSELRIRLDMTFDVPKEIADQLEMWGFNTLRIAIMILTAGSSK